MLSLQRLVVLHELERQGTLAAVARVLSYSPSAVSQQLAQLEREVGTALTEPVGRGVRLTDAARVLVERTRAALAELERAEAEIAEMEGRVAGRLRVASFQTVVLSVLPAALSELEARLPQLRIDIAQREPDDSTAGLLAGAFDVVIGEEYPGAPVAPDPRAHRQELGADELLLVVPRSRPWRAATDLADAAGAAWALDPEDSAPGRWARDRCRAAGFEPDVRFDGPDLLMHVHLVQAGQAVSLLPGLLARERMRGTRLIPLPGRPQRQLFTLTRATRAAHPAVVAFREALGHSFDAQDRPAPAAARP